MSDVQISVTETDVQIAVIDQENTQLALAAPDETQVTVAVPGVQGPIGATGTIAGAQDGTEAAPGISFLADTDTGIYRVGANSIGVSTGGVSRFVIDAAGQIETVGLGSGAAPAYSWFGDQNTGIYSPGADQLAISTNGTGRLFVDSNGNVGVGGATSTNILECRSSTNSTIGITRTASHNVTLNAIAGGHFTIGLDGSGGGTERLRLTSTGALNFVGAGTAGSTQAVSFNGSAPVNSLVIDSSGRVGLGTSSPAELLDCKGNIVLGAQNAASGTLQPTSGSGTDVNGSHLVLRAGRPTGSGSSGQVQICPSASSTTSGTSVRQNKTKGLYLRDQLTSWDNNVSYGMLNAVFGNSATEGNRSNLGNDGAVVTIDGANNGSQSALEIVGSSNATNATQGFIRFFGSGSKNPYATIAATTPGVAYTSGNLQIRTYNAGVEGAVATFTDTGRVGIGTSGPTESIHTTGALRVTGFQTTAGTGIYLDQTAGVGNVSVYGPDNSTQGTFRVYTATANGGTGSAKLIVDSSGRVGIGTTSPSQTLDVATGYANLSGVRIGADGSNDIYRNNALFVSCTDVLVFKTGAGPTERARIDSSGRLLVGTSSQSGGSLLQVNDNRIRIATAKTPASATDTGVAGEICWDANYVYVCTATNTWKRTAISTW